MLSFKLASVLPVFEICKDKESVLSSFLMPKLRLIGLTRILWAMALLVSNKQNSRRNFFTIRFNAVYKGRHFFGVMAGNQEVLLKVI